MKRDSSQLVAKTKTANETDKIQLINFVVEHIFFKMNKIILQSACVSKFGLEIQVGLLKKSFSDAVQGLIAVAVDNFIVFTDENIILFGSQQPNQPKITEIFFSNVLIVENNVMNGFIGVLELPRALNVDVIAVSSKNNQAQARNNDNHSVIMIGTIKTATCESINRFFIVMS